eukprot:TRINITY_DN6571_c0_g2_i1.p2 TRINITY_DN6571_c0_g2~~TRINITY_DN6571_c0_g2_i1.p2  ORF type:complete len:181 (-),score=56.75 TRINITY_DN6571_c0_g2_i1:1261-1803(-)
MRIPESWSAVSGKETLKSKTQTQLKEQRKQANLPDPSYDLDKDGFVSAREYFISKQFDKDRDGRLNTAEKADAMRALSSEYEDGFVWNLEAQGSQGGKRLLQVRGKFVNAEDFVPVAESYPAHPLSKVQPRVKTARELKGRRRAEMIEELRKGKEEWDRMNPVSVPNEYKLSEFLVCKPK